MIKRISAIILIPLVCLACQGGPTAALSQTSRLVMNTADEPPNSTASLDGIADLAMRAACRRLGIELAIVRLPSERALVNANAGVEDGNFARVAGLSTIYPNLIQVPEPITRFEFVAISTGLKFPVTSWDSLKPYHVGIVTGWKILERNIVGVKSLTKVRDQRALLMMLSAGRVDCVVYDRRQALVEAASQGLDNLVIMAPPLAVRDMYPYLHKRHLDLVPQLATAIRAIKADGSYQTMVKEVMTRYGTTQ